MKDKEEKEVVNINQPVDKDAYRKIKAYAVLNKRNIQDLVNEAIIEKAAKIKL